MGKVTSDVLLNIRAKKKKNSQNSHTAYLVYNQESVLRATV